MGNIGKVSPMEPPNLKNTGNTRFPVIKINNKPHCDTVQINQHPC